MPPKFGTSGLRGLVVELTSDLVRSYTLAFLEACPHGGALHVGQDLRESSPDIAETVMRTAQDAGLDVIDHAALPTPALALAAMKQSQAAIMVTGSHIPNDRNGLKFYRPDGEISKADEAAMQACVGTDTERSHTQGTRRSAPDTLALYEERYVSAFGAQALSGLRIGVYEHSSVARDVLSETLTAMGAEVIKLGRSETFVPVDTEAVDQDMKTQFADWCVENALDALVSTDGDADRPMLTDALGQPVPGDVLGPLTARMLGADVICTPVSSNSVVGEMGFFSNVYRCMIGSPHVIAAMEAVQPDRVVGYEANGGFLLGFAAEGPVGAISPLMTRDSLLPIIAPLVEANAAGVSVADLVGRLPARFTSSDRLKDIPNAAAHAFINGLTQSTENRAAFFADHAVEVALDLTDGLRVSFADDSVIHLRPSGNAPEFRCYAEANSKQRAEKLVMETLTRVQKQVLT